MINTFTKLRRELALAVLFATGSLVAQAQNVGIGTTAPTQTLDVNGALRVRSLSGSDTRLPVVLPDGTLGVNAPVYGTTPIARALPTAATGSVATDRGPYSVAVSGTTAYVVNYYGNSLQVFNVATPSAPVLLGTVATDYSPCSVAVSGTTAYVVNQSSNTLQVFNVVTPSAPVLLGSVATDSQPYSVAVSGTTAYVVNSLGSTLQIFDVATPSAPVLLGTVATGRAPRSVAVSGTTAYVVNFFGRALQAFNVATPSAPVLLGSVATDANPGSVVVSGTTAYVVNYYGNSLQAFSVATPSAPVLLGSVATDANPGSVAVSGTTAYVVNYSGNSLQAFSVATPSAPVLLGSVATGANPQSVAVSGTTAYVVNLRGNTLQAFVIPGPPRAVAVNADGSLASVALPDGTSFIQNQTAAVQAGGFNLSGNGYVSGNVGIGTSAPAAKLMVQLASDADLGLRVTDGTTTGNIVIQPLTGGNTGFSTINYNGYYGIAGETRFNTTKNRWRVGTDQRSTNDLFFIDTYNGTIGSNLLAVTATGNVGIGTSAPTQVLDVNGGIVVRANGAITNQGAHLQWNRSGGEGETWLINHLGRGNGNAGIRFAGITTSTGTVPTEWARFLNNGNLGIGTTAPTQQLEVAGQVFSNSGGFRFPDNTVQTTAATVTATNGLSQTGSTIGLGGSLTRATTITQAGNAFSMSGGSVGIGTTTPSSSETLDVNGSLRVGTSTTPGAVHTSTTGTHNMLAVAYGVAGGSTGDILSTSGNYTVTRTGQGSYDIVFTAASGLSMTDFTNVPAIFTILNSPGFAYYHSYNPGSISVFTSAPNYSIDLYFSFVVFVP